MPVDPETGEGLDVRKCQKLYGNAPVLKYFAESDDSPGGWYKGTVKTVAGELEYDEDDNGMMAVNKGIFMHVWYVIC